MFKYEDIQYYCDISCDTVDVFDEKEKREKEEKLRLFFVFVEREVIVT